MKNTLFALTGLIAVFTAVVPSAEAYNGLVTDVRYGEHPYEQRARDERRRKRLAEQAEQSGYATFDNPAYYHPIYAQRSVLHPFYRKGGTTQYLDGRFARWRGYQDPALAKALSPDTYCTNYTYSRSTYRDMPTGYQCF